MLNKLLTTESTRTVMGDDFYGIHQKTGETCRASEDGFGTSENHSDYVAAVATYSKPTLSYWCKVFFTVKGGLHLW